MELVAFYSRRRSMAWYAGILALALIGIAVMAHQATVQINGAAPVLRFPVAAIPPIAMFFSAVFATTAALSLNRENATLEFAWTKPISRPMLALRYVAVDVTAILIAYLLAWLAAIAVTAIFGAQLISTGVELPLTALSVGVTLMWYGLLQLVTATMPAGAGLVAGLSWPVAFILLSISNAFGPTFASIMHVVNTFNPFAYLSGVNVGSGKAGLTVAHTTSFWHHPIETRIAIVFGLAIAYVVIAIALWSHREV